MNGRKLFIRLLVLLTIVVGPLSTVAAKPVYDLSAPDAPSPLPWQQTATGLQTTQDNGYTTSGLGFMVERGDWPFLRLWGGAKNEVDWWYGHFSLSATDIQLGQVKIPGASGVFSSETVDWAHNELTFNAGAPNQLKVWASRLTPALLTQSSTNLLGVLSGNVSGYVYSGSDVVDRPAAPSYPKYAAFSSGGSTQVIPLSSATTALSLDQNWLLLWYGSNSHFIDSKVPLVYYGVPWSQGYAADAPVLVIFQNLPTSIRHSSEGGVEFGFSGGAGYVTLLPLFGRNIQRVAQTETWSSGLPGDVQQRVNWWSSHLCDFPVTSEESYSYTTSTDTATIAENITFISTCSGGIRLAPIPPMLGLVRDVLNVSFSGAVVDGNLATEFGPAVGIENTQTYTWSVSGLKKYVDARRVSFGNGSVPPELEQSLTSEVNKLVAGGHYRPWLLLDATPRWTGLAIGELYWANPADTVYQLAEVAQALPEGATRNSLIDYIRTERTQYPPEDVYDLDLQTGKIRPEFSAYYGDWQWVWEVFRTDAHQTRVPLYNYLALARYYELTGEAIPSEVILKADQALDRDMREQDWASFYWFYGFEDRRMAVVNANRFFAGVVGYTQLAEKVGNQASENLGRALLAKAAVLRIGMAKYPRYLYTAGLVELPAQADWQVRYSAGGNFGQVFNNSWTGPYDDARQVAWLNQLGVYLYEHSGFGGWGTTHWDAWNRSPYMIPFRDLTPELGRLLSDYALNDSLIYINKVEAFMPTWYTAFSEAVLGNEHNLNHPVDSFQIFMAKALIQNETPANLARYADIGWLREGDLFYMQKLAEATRAYRGVGWNDTISLSAHGGDNTIGLTWRFLGSLPADTSWQIEYQGPPGDQPSPISNLDADTRSYTLTGVTNYAWYSVKVSIMVNGAPVLSSDWAQAMPTDYSIWLTLIKK